MVGAPVRHSLSPTIYNAAFAADGLDWSFVAFEVGEGCGAAAVDAARVLGLAGLSVTMPLKHEVAAAVDELTDDARALGAVNSVKHDGGVLTGGNTDGRGFVRALRAETGFEVPDQCCVVLGAGGAARAVVRALAVEGAREVVVVNRNAERANRAVELAGDRGRAGTVDDIAAADLVVNATPVGMVGGEVGATPFDVSSLRAGQVVADLVYVPSETALVREARQRGITAVSGLGMLVHQAALQYEWWTGRIAPLDAMFDAVREQLGRR